MQKILSTTKTLLARSAFEQASALLADHIPDLLNHTGLQGLQECLHSFPPAQIDTDANLRYVMGWLYSRLGCVAEAIHLLERAKFSYRHQGNQARVVRCNLELARIYQSREQFRTAYVLLCDEVAPLIEQDLLSEPDLQASFYLRMAEISADVGRLPDSIPYAQRALALYRRVGDADGEFRCLTRLATTAHEHADFVEARSNIHFAQACARATSLGNHATVRLLNLELHDHWYRGNLQQAAEVAKQLRLLSDQANIDSQRVYARVLLGNLKRALGQLEEAEFWYTETRQIAQQIDYVNYYPWIDTQHAWLRILQGEWAEARRLAHQSLKTADLEQAMSFQVPLGILSLLEGELPLARQLLTESLEHYRQTKEQFVICALQLYVGLIALRAHDLCNAQLYVQAAFTWMAQMRIDYIPFWWHPLLMSEICAYALTMKFAPQVVEAIFINHLRQAGTAALRSVQTSSEPTVSQRACTILHTLGEDEFAVLDQFPDSHVKQVLAELLRNHQLRSDCFVRLQHALTTANHRHTPNLTLLAVFGLYLQGYTRREIAKKLQCSTTHTRNCITLIYQHFGLDTATFHSRQERQQQLRKLAQAQGFIP